MSERKVLNKYYPPDFDPNKIPRLKQKRDGKFAIRTMAPFNMRCNTCGEYIYKGKKFNARKEDVENERYLGLYIYRFYIKCPRCVAEIAFKTDPRNTDYELEAGATRNFEAQRTAEMLARKEMEEKEAEDKNNPMKVLENRTKASLQEMDMIETLEELRELRQSQGGVALDEVLEMNAEEVREAERRRAEREEEEDEEFVRSIFGPEGQRVIKRLNSDDEDDDSKTVTYSKRSKVPASGEMATDILTSDDSTISSTQQQKTTSAYNSKEDLKKPLGGSVASTKSSTSSKGKSLRESILKGIVVNSKAKSSTTSTASSPKPSSTTSDNSIDNELTSETNSQPSTSKQVDTVSLSHNTVLAMKNDTKSSIKVKDSLVKDKESNNTCLVGSSNDAGPSGLASLGCYGSSSDSEED